MVVNTMEIIPAEGKSNRLGNHHWADAGKGCAIEAKKEGLVFMKRLIVASSLSRNTKIAETITRGCQGQQADFRQGISVFNASEF